MSTIAKRPPNKKSKLNSSIGWAIREIRTNKRLTQEAFATVSSRTYLGVLERGEKQPTVDKIDNLAQFMNVHPLTVLSLAYMKSENKSFEELVDIVSGELSVWNNPNRFEDIS